MKSNAQLAEIIIRCWSDEEFKKKFKENPQSIFEEYGLPLNESATKIEIVENTDSRSYFVLPSKPESLDFNEEQLKTYVEELVAVQLVLPTILV